MPALQVPMILGHSVALELEVKLVLLVERVLEEELRLSL
jgi:hypothetical protein